jgi:hypothetical protein
MNMKILCSSAFLFSYFTYQKNSNYDFFELDLVIEDYNNSIQFFIIYVSSQQLQGQL